jgi:hypothetical protein
MKRIYAVVALVLIAAMIFTGCSSAAPTKNESYDTGKAETPAEAPAAEMPVPAPQEGITDSDVLGSDGKTGADTSELSILEPGVNRKVIYNGTIEANTKEFDKDYENIMNQLRTVGGYLQSSNIYGSKPEDWQDEGRQAQLVLRVPNDKFDEFITMLKGLGQNLTTSTSGEDISLQYYDTETKLGTLRNRQSRLEEMLKNPAYTLDSIIQLEKELADVTYEIQMLETNLRTYDSLIDFSTINITLHEVMEIKAITPAKEDLGTRMSSGLFSVLNALADFGEGLLVFFVSGSPVIVPLAAVIVLIIMLVRRSHKKRGRGVPPWMEGGQNNVKPQ